MKKILFYLLMATMTSTFFFSCTELMEQEVFNTTFLHGQWQSGTLYYKYLENGTGGTWDTSEDVNEAEAQLFTWTLVNDEFTHIHIMESGSTGVPKVYTVTELTASSLKYKDDFGASHSFTKVD
ncbi:MAG: hypothetical protein ACOCXH_13785 [Cyclobacteriaceae bacterium]